MPLINLRGLGRRYRVRVKCTNCGEIQELSVPKGETIANYIKDERAICTLCGCNTLELKRSNGHQTEPKRAFG
jgi:formate dehydrogenase maturation protein FdhE